jgi:hypothetical protein
MHGREGFCWGNVRVVACFEDLDVDGICILKFILEKYSE